MPNQLRVDVIVAGADQALGNVDKLERKIVGAEKQLRSLGGAANSAGSAIGQGLGIPLGPAAALTAATAGIALGLHTVIAAAREGADANRVLSSSATEAGLSYQLATEKAQKFAAQTGLSDTQAKQTFSSIIQVAKVANQTDDLDNIQKRFADLAAARGVAAKDLSTLSQQILSGQDEALNRLGLADPSKLAKDWADAHGRTVESMTQTEQVASRLDAVMRKGAMFDGSAEERLKSVSGQITQTEQAMANLTTGVGEAIFANMEFRDLLSTVNGVLKEMALSSDDVAAKLNAGMTPAQIAAEQAGGIWNETLDEIKNKLNVIPAFAVGMWDSLFSTKTLREILEQTNVMMFGAGDRRKQELQQQIESEKLGIEAQKKAAADQKLINADKIKTDAALIASKRDLAAEEAKQKKAQELSISTFKDTQAFLDDMLQRTNKDNPFVKLFTDADTVMERMQKRFGAFGQEFVGMMAKVENQAIAMEQLAARIQSAQKVLDIQAEIRKLQFGPTGTSAEDQRQLGVFDKRIDAARDIPGLEASARAVAEGRFPGEVDAGAILNQQIAEIRKLKTEFFATDFGNREGQSKINQEIIALFSGATDEQKQKLLKGGFGADLSGAFQGQANDRRQAIEDEQKRAEVGRVAIQDAMKSLSSLKQFGGLDNDEVRKQFLSKTGALGEGELTPQLRRERIGALEIEKKKESEKEKQAEADRKKLNGVLDLITSQLTGAGLKTDSAAQLLLEIKDKSGKAEVTGPAMGDVSAQDQQDMRQSRW